MLVAIQATVCMRLLARRGLEGARAEMPKLAVAREHPKMKAPSRPSSRIRPDPKAGILGL